MKRWLRTLNVRASAALMCGSIYFGAPMGAAGQELRSAALAKELGSLLTAAKLDAFAMQDPEAPDRFIAALLFPEVQLLMVSARHASPDYLKYQIEQKQYKEVYTVLQQGGLTESRLFFQDLGADGLSKPGSQSVDVVYVSGVQTLFDGKGEGSRQEYEKKLREADAQYSRLLQLAIDALKQPAAPGGVPIGAVPPQR